MESLRYETATGELRRRTVYVSATRQFGRHGLRFGLARAQNASGSAVETIGTVFAINSLRREADVPGSTLPGVVPGIAA